jgi:hypothetical protein
METISIIEPHPQLTEFMNMAPGPYKRLVYNQTIKGSEYSESNLLKKQDGSLYYSHCTYSVKPSKDSFYKQRKKKTGFSFEKGKLSLWFGASQLHEMPGLLQILRHLKAEWIDNSPYLLQFVTKGILEKILRKKITNPVDLCKEYLKVSRINASPALFYKAVCDNKVCRSRIHKWNRVAKDINHAIEYYSFLDNSVFHPMTLPDMEDQAFVLSRKIDYKWSEKRMAQEHQNWTRDIMELEIDNLSQDYIEELEFLKLYPLEGLQLLDNQQAVFREGKQMQHCVYTNYWGSVKRGMYAVYAVDYKGERATLGLRIEDDRIRFNQLYGKRNSAASSELHQYIISWIEAVNQELCRSSIIPSIVRQPEFEMI